jgi:hypothetical protein
VTSPVPGGTEQVAQVICEPHAYEYRIRGGEPLTIPICMLCGAVGWADIREQLAAAAPYIAAKALRDIAAEDGGSLLATAWVLRRADDIERAARAAGKDKTDG